MAQSISKERLSQIFYKEITQIIASDVKDPHVGFVTITDIDLTPDLSLATIYVSFLGKKERNDAGLKALNRAKGYIKKELSQRVKVRKIPDLQFKIDTSVAKGNRIDELIASIHKDD